ncbi:MAG: hypothetical protein IJX92_05720 [Clostridia bacterium]|nr:hypothetical protein [Clostridia bacterium]
MSDFERYGDYNEVDEAPGGSTVSKIMKILIFILCFAVVGFIVFRLIVFNYYPESVSNIYYTAPLTEYYNETDGDIGALTQDLLNSRNYGYDDPEEGNFFCKNLILIPKIDQLQVTLRYNTSLMKTLEEEFGLTELDPDGDLFTYSLVAMRKGDEADPDAPNEEQGTPMEATLVATERDSLLMYRYVKLVFDGVDLGTEGADDWIDWIRLEVRVNGAEKADPFMILIYYSSDKFPLVPYELSDKEAP